MNLSEIIDENTETENEERLSEENDMSEIKRDFTAFIDSHRENNKDNTEPELIMQSRNIMENKLIGFMKKYKRW